MRHTILNKNNSKNINLLIFYFIIIEFGFVSSTDLGGGGFWGQQSKGQKFTDCNYIRDQSPTGFVY